MSRLRIAAVVVLCACTGGNLDFTEPDVAESAAGLDAAAGGGMDALLDGGQSDGELTVPDVVAPTPDDRPLDPRDASSSSIDQGPSDVAPRPHEPDFGPPPDLDVDGQSDLIDNCLEVANPDQADRDADGRGDLCDRCPDGGDGVDADGDGSMACEDDCDDSDPSRHPGALERCDGLDNDCEGTPDDPFFDLARPCEQGLGLCRGAGAFVCLADGSGTRCDAPSLAPVGEVCDTFDNDCDGNADEGLAECCRMGDVLPCGQDRGRCRAGVQTCDAQGSYGVCDGTGPAAEICNGVDDDCDGFTDEDGGCGPYVRQSCRVWLAWGMNGEGADVADAWGPCPGVDRHRDGNLQCASTPWRADAPGAIFWDVNVRGEVNADDRLGVRFECADPANEALASYVETHCAVYFGWSDFDGGPQDSQVWGPCPGRPSGEADGRRCVSSGLDTRFHSMRLDGIVDRNDDFGVAFLCRDEADPGRAAGLQSAVDVWLAGDDDSNPERNGSGDWGDCPGDALDVSGSTRCVSSRGDGLFHKFDASESFRDGATFGVGLSVRGQ